MGKSLFQSTARWLSSQTSSQYILFLLDGFNPPRDGCLLRPLPFVTRLVTIIYKRKIHDPHAKSASGAVSVGGPQCII